MGSDTSLNGFGVQTESSLDQQQHNAVKSVQSRAGKINHEGQRDQVGEREGIIYRLVQSILHELSSAQLTSNQRKDSGTMSEKEGELFAGSFAT